MKINFKIYSLYLLRWQLSTPILALCLIWLNSFNPTIATIVANFIGGLIFFWIDKYIFKYKSLDALWHIKEEVICSDCNKKSRGYRLVKTINYNKEEDKKPKFRCEECSVLKTNKLKLDGVKLNYE